MMTLWFCFALISGRNDVSYSAEFTDRMGSRNAAHPGVRMQFRSATNKNLNGDDPHTEKNVSYTVVGN